LPVAVDMGTILRQIDMQYLNTKSSSLKFRSGALKMERSRTLKQVLEDLNSHVRRRPPCVGLSSKMLAEDKVPLELFNTPLTFRSENFGASTCLPAGDSLGVGFTTSTVY
jgi:hypothetical protein